MSKQESEDGDNAEVAVEEQEVSKQEVSEQEVSSEESRNQRGTVRNLHKKKN